MDSIQANLTFPITSTTWTVQMGEYFNEIYNLSKVEDFKDMF